MYKNEIRSIKVGTILNKTYRPWKEFYADYTLINFYLFIDAPRCVKWIELKYYA